MESKGACGTYCKVGNKILQSSGEGERRDKPAPPNLRVFSPLLKIEESSYSEILLSVYQNTWRHTLE
jgi:hypothetical protein